MAANVDVFSTSGTRPSDDEEPLAKRPRLLACARCRRRKQKCNGLRPCPNCQRSGEECHDPPSAYARPTFDSATAPNLQGAPPHMPLAWLGDIASLEERISLLEEANRRLTAERDARPAPGKGSTTCHTHEGHSQLISESPLTRISPAIGLLSSFSRLENHQQSPDAQLGTSTAGESQLPDVEGSLDWQTHEALFNTYYDKVHCRYPFLRLDQFRRLETAPTAAAPWARYFYNMILSIGLLLDKNGPSASSQNSPQQSFYRLAITRYLSHVFAQPDRILHIQAYLLLAMHAIYSPSSERIISIASATMRYCVMAQFHLAESEPEPVNVAAKVEAQMRRRVFWSAYALDRTASTCFDLPFSCPDYQISVKMYSDVNDHELEQRCAESFPEDPPSRHCLTNVSAALHVVYCRQIQSDILNTTLHRDFSKQFDHISGWRVRVLEKLDQWKALCHRYSETDGPFKSREWLHMIYNYSLAMLYQPNKKTAAGPAGDWVLRASIQAIIIFRKFQRKAPISELWLGLIFQFRCGVALLYCFFATAPQSRSDAYKIPDASEAVRACSIILSILAERWPQSICLRDAFDILAREIPLFEMGGGPQKMRPEASDSLLALLPQLEPIVVHRNTLRMIREMAMDDFFAGVADPVAHSIADDGGRMSPSAEEGSALWRTPGTGEFFDPTTPYFFQGDMGDINTDFQFPALGFPGDFDPDTVF